MTALPPLNLMGWNNPRLAKEGFKTFRGLVTDKRDILLQAIDTILTNPQHKMGKLIARQNLKKFQQEVKDPELSLDELGIIPKPPRTLNFMQDAMVKSIDDEDGLKELEMERRRKLAAIVNPYLSSKQQCTPMVTPQKLTTHTKNKIETTPRNNLKDPPMYSPLPITQNDPDTAPTQELEAIVQNTERILDAATAAFHNDDNDGLTPSTNILIQGLGTLQPTAESQTQMQSLIKYMNALNAKYRRWIQEYKENKKNHKDAFQATLSALTKRFEDQARHNIEHIVTTVSSQTERNIQQKISTMLRP
jgi:hypothetical protein